MQNIIILITLLCLLAACGSAPSGPIAASATASSAATASASIMAPGATNTPSASPSEAALLPSATSDVPSTGASDDTVLCRLTRSGGLAGSTETVTVHTNGDVTAQRDRPTARTATMRATPEQLATLRAALRSDAWQQLQRRYGRPVPDSFMYVVQCGDTMITTYDGAQRPDVLNEMIQQLSALQRQALQ